MSENTTLATVDSVDFNIPTGYICTVDLNTDEGAIAAANALGAASSLDKANLDEFVIVDVITKPGIRAISGDECTDVILILDDGSCMFTQSIGIFKSVQFMVASFGLDRLHRGVRVKLISQPTKQDKEIKMLKVLGFAS